jgi:UDP-glucose 4-epimerase
MRILLTGGAGYIGSHTALTLLKAGFEVIIFDNLSNSSFEPLRRVSKLVNKPVKIIKGDVRNFEALRDIFRNNEVDAVVHFAGLKAVGESAVKPLEYYDNNFNGSVILLKAMSDAGVYKFIFSSSATVYSEKQKMPISETNQTGNLTNPYGRSKLMVEDMLKDLAAANPLWKIAILRYFNPVGADESGQIGEDPRGVPNNLVPYIAQVAMGRIPHLSIFGNDYQTIDGTGVRDYIHVADLAQGHLSAIAALNRLCGAHVWNLGTGQGYSVLQIVRNFEICSGKAIPYQFCSRRPGDIAICYSDASKAERELGWKAKRGLEEMLNDTWRWQLMNPEGYC